MLPIVQSRTPSVYDRLGLNFMKHYADNWDSTMYKPMVAMFIEIFWAGTVEHVNNPSSWEAEFPCSKFPWNIKYDVFSFLEINRKGMIWCYYVSREIIRHASLCPYHFNHLGYQIDQPPVPVLYLVLGKEASLQQTQKTQQRKISEIYSFKPDKFIVYTLGNTGRCFVQKKGMAVYEGMP